MSKRWLALFAFAALSTLLPLTRGAAAPSNVPVVLYTDIASGPNSGGENNHGAYLSIFGNNFVNGCLGT